MKLYHTQTSPFVRKVMLAAHELGLADRIETIHLRPNALEPDPTLSAHNPLSKIPALVTPDGTLYDSVVICEYLDALGGHRLIPREGPARWETLTRQSLADGILDAGVLIFYERLHRPADLQWPRWLEGQQRKVEQGLDALERVASPDAPLDLGWLAAAAAIGWLEFREVVDVRAGRPALTAWYTAFAKRPAMLRTWPST